jgi:hypothetical protein
MLSGLSWSGIDRALDALSSVQLLVEPAKDNSEHPARDNGDYSHDEIVDECASEARL